MRVGKPVSFWTFYDVVHCRLPSRDVLCTNGHVSLEFREKVHARDKNLGNC